ncbi:MAG: hypothetical protein ACYDDS_21415 [Candidatus Sulfotelmatobacter sp.]
MAFENPMVFGWEVITVKQIFFYQLPGDNESIASEGQALGSIRSCLGVEHQHGVGTLPFPFRLVKVSILISQTRKDADGDDQRRGFMV